MKKAVIFFLVLFCLFSTITVYGDEDNYYVKDSHSGEVIKDFKSLALATSFYNANKNNYDNLELLHNNETLEVEYGVVEFKKDDACSLNTTYFSLPNNNHNEINGCYVSDAAYLYTKNDEVYFVLANDTGRVSKNDVVLHSVDDYIDRISLYEVKDGYLYHKIKSYFESEYYSYYLKLDYLDGLLSDGDYFSFDGHYFYSSYDKMIDDYLAKKHNNAINQEAYYNYYQYLPFRSHSNISYDEINDYFTKSLHIDGKLNSYNDYNKDGANDEVNKSQYYGELEAFYGCEGLYGINPLLLLSISIYESSYGKSELAFKENNLFASAAYALYDRDYLSLEESVYAFAKHYLSDRFLSYVRTTYKGGYLGDKLSGMNAYYSKDPYWSEKVVQAYQMIDEYLGDKDKNNIPYLFMKDGLINVYKDDNFKTLLFRVDDSYNYSILPLKKINKGYKVQVDPSFDADCLYDYAKAVGYIKDEDVSKLVGQSDYSEPTYTDVVIDLGGGLINDGNINVYHSFDGNIYLKPYKKGYEFTGFKDNVAKYSKIEKVELKGTLPDRYLINQEIDYGDAYLKVSYEDKASEKIDITSENLRFSTDQYGEKEIKVCVNEVCDLTKIKVSQVDSILRESVKEKIAYNIKSYQNDRSYSKDDLRYIKDNLGKTDIQLTINEIRYLDIMYLKMTNGYPVYHFETDEYNLSFSGLALALPDSKGKNFFQLFDDTYYISVSNPKEKYIDYMKDFVEPYGFEVDTNMNIHFGLNLLTVHPGSEIVVQIKPNSPMTDKIFSVYHLDTKTMTVTKCKTYQSNSYIQFLTDKDGVFVLLSIDSCNIYDLSDGQENTTLLDNYPDTFRAILYTLIFMIFFISICIGSIKFISDKSHRNNV